MSEQNNYCKDCKVGMGHNVHNDVEVCYHWLTRNGKCPHDKEIFEILLQSYSNKAPPVAQEHPLMDNWS